MYYVFIFLFVYTYVYIYIPVAAGSGSQSGDPDPATCYVGALGSECDTTGTEKHRKAPGLTRYFPVP